MATLDQALAQMQAADMPPLPQGHPVIDGRIHRFGGREKKCWYVLHEFAARNGRRYIVGAFGRWQGTDNGKIPIKADFTGIEPDELQRLQRSQVASEEKEREKRARVARFAAGRAYEQWRAGRARLGEGETVPYLQKKRLQWENGLRMFSDGTLIVPMVRYDVTEAQDEDPAYTGPRRLAGLQKIKPDGFKLFNKGMDPVGVACRFGRKPKDGDLMLVGEGLATVLSVHQGLERAYTSWVAFVAGNLERIGRQLRAQYPKSPILFLADDDAYLEAQLNKRLIVEYAVEEPYKVLDGERTMKSKFGPLTVNAHVHEDSRGTPVLTAGLTVGDKLRTLVLRNTGRAKAWDAASAIGNAWVTWPRFASRELKPDPALPRLTDFNDLHVSEGSGKVTDQVGEAIKAIEDARELAASVAAGAPAQAAGAGGGGKGGDDEPDWQLHGNLIRRFTLIERSGAAWDVERGFLWKIEHMRLSYGTRSVNMWLASPRTRKIDASLMVFDPTGKTDPKTTVNLFRGLGVQPSTSGSCERLLKLLRYLCGEAEDTHTPISDWVIKWCAYQVQHVGAKMRTAIVMHGPEGSGKNQFWSAMQEIFHPYSAQIGQAELEDKFNGWLSARLFLVANEVVTRAEMSHHVGKLKAYVTEPYLHIRTAYMDARYEKNHANIVFLSNEFQPLKISPGDRRYMVIRTPPIMESTFYKDVAAELGAGGAAAFMHYLRGVELGDFNEHTKPIITTAKRELIELGMLPSQLFWQGIKDGLVQLPYVPALSEDVYRAYTLWCMRNGHKMPEALNRFTPAFMSMNGVRRAEPRVPDPEKLNELALVEDKLRKRRVFLMGERPFGVEDRQWIVDGIKAFRLALRAYEAEGGRDSGGSAQANQERAF